MSGTILLFLRLALALALYGFLGWALLTLWWDLKRQVERSALREAPLLTLFFQLDEEPASHRFDTTEILVGRDPACDFLINDSTVSGNHARLSYHHNHWWIEDLHSRNGTFLNQEPVTSPLVLTQGDEVRCGQATFSILMEEN
jgi:hypothetical protein